MKFFSEGRKILVKGANQTKLKIPSPKNISKAVEESAQIAVLQQLGQGAEFFTIQVSIPETIHPDMQHLLNNYNDIFAEPKGLPPLREGHNHKIQLKGSAEPINIRPYKCPMLQKDVIETISWCRNYLRIEQYAIAQALMPHQSFW
ncbi:hypothetical protein RND81_03G168200 [Saponaria officinalis]|uniref:Uncharacterized protein n=1 Tax=Saponaria officinalis TaxID=3572 RepID=A0AAW1M8Q1_SAPOF